jgi:hypothetical protein
MANEKFSQFASGGNLQAGDIVVGLRAGANTQFTASTTVNSNVYAPARLFSDQNLNATYNNGASGVGATLTGNVNGLLVIDTIGVQVNDRIIVSEQSTATENGIYVVTQTGSVGTPFILTRATDFDTPAKIIEGGVIPVTAGFDYVGSVAVVASAPAVIGTNLIGITSTMEQALVILKFLQAGNNLSDITSPITAFDNISPVNSVGELLGFNGSQSAALAPGTNNFVLTADNTQTLGFKWAAPTSGFAFTAKGQLITYDGTTVQYENVGTDTFVLTADSTQPNGIKWGSIPSQFNFTTKGQLITYDGTLIQYLNAGTDGFVLTADSTQPDGIKWASSPPVVLTNPNCIAYTNNSTVLSTNTNLEYFDTNNQLIQDTAPGSITGQNVATLASNNTNLTINYAFVAASDTTSISALNSSIVASTSATISPLGNSNFIAAANTAFMDTSVLKSVIMGTTSATIHSGSTRSGIICGEGAVTGSFSLIMGCDASNIGGVGSVILGGTTNTIAGNFSAVIAGQSSLVSGANSIAFGRAATVSAAGSMLFNDGSGTANNLATTNAASLMFTNGVGIGTIAPQSSSALDIVSTTKAVKLPNVNGTGTIATPVQGMLIADTSTNQLMYYNGSAWVIAG